MFEDKAQQPGYIARLVEIIRGKWSDWERLWNVFCSPISHRNQGVCAEGGGREGKVHALRIMFLSWTSWQRAVPNAGKGWLLNLEPGFPFHTVFVPSPWLSPLGRTSVGTVPVSLPLLAQPS